jgi:peptidoglycan hydrolase-like protein with peptidoglycan-binding domain
MPTPFPDTPDTLAPDAGRRGQAPPALTARRKRPLVLAGTGLALAAAAGFAVRAAWPPAAHPGAATQNVPVSVATVIRTDVTSRQAEAGSLGYAGSFSVADELTAGIITWLPAAGSVVGRDQVLFQVAGQPVILLYGPVPAWRDFTPGMTQGPDVRQLQRNLTALGYHSGPADGQYGWSTQVAVERWQQAHRLTATGTIPLGQVAFLPGPLRVTAATESLGSPAAPGAAVLSGTSDTPVVTVSLTVGGPAVRPGDQVLVTMPDGTTTVPGVVSSVGRVATPSAAAGSGGSGSAAGASSAVIPVTVRISMSRLPPGLDQAPVQVSIIQQRDRGVLAVPVTALLAEPGGGYAVRVSGPAHQLIPVTTGVFDGSTGLVEVAGRGLTDGLSVEVAAG